VLGGSMLINSIIRKGMIITLIALLMAPATTSFISSKMSYIVGEENTTQIQRNATSTNEIHDDSLIKFERVNIGCFIWGKGRMMHNKLYIYILDELSSELHKKYPKIAKLLSKIADKLSEIDAKIPVTISLLAGFCGKSMNLKVTGLLGTWDLYGGVSIIMIGFTGILTEDFVFGYAPFVGFEMYNPYPTQ